MRSCPRFPRGGGVTGNGGGLKHAAGLGSVSRPRNRLREMTGKGKVTKALGLRLVPAAELKRLSGSKPQRGWGAGAGEVNGRPTHVQSPPVYRGALPPVVGTPGGTW
jgi:hypothetical protein